MPIQVDLETRLSEIAAATLRVAGVGGLRGVTIRSVAAELGASTTVITNYLPTRSSLLVNALRHIESSWLSELEAELVGSTPAQSLRKAMRLAVSWDAEELLRAHFWIAVLAVQQRDEQIQGHLDESNAAFRSVFAKLVDQCGHPDPASAADRLLLITQGAFVSIVETPSEWTNARLIAVADGAVDAVLSEAGFGE
ncbi:MAG: TetR/AcrR family transcriptional regulator [Acidimicrobiia bacterium]|nr:TetR/AcrR family transcriptional regulator [Acidimicrobiia bacterium]